jgi:hypothetical protein
MATDKKHIAVYLDPAVEQALIAFCQEKGLISKKGTMYSAGVNAALAAFFGAANTDKSNTPETTDNILQPIGNTPKVTGGLLQSGGNIPIQNSTELSSIPIVTTGNIPSKTLIGKVMPGK